MCLGWGLVLEESPLGVSTPANTVVDVGVGIIVFALVWCYFPHGWDKKRGESLEKRGMGWEVEVEGKCVRSEWMKWEEQGIGIQWGIYGGTRDRYTRQD